MIFNYKSKSNVKMVITVAQIFHILYALFVVAYVCVGLFKFKIYKNDNKNEKLKFLGYITLFIGLGCLINVSIVNAVSNLK